MSGKDQARAIDEARRTQHRELLTKAQRFKRWGLRLLALALVCWLWAVARCLFADIGTACEPDDYGPVDWCVGLVPLAELLLLLAAAMLLGVAGAALYTRGAVSAELSHHTLSTAQYLDRAQEAALREELAGDGGS
jgi:hypothetical protein